MDETLYDKLRRLGVQFNARDIRAPEPAEHATHPIDQVVEGYYHSNRLGDTFVCARTYEPQYRHGSVDFAEVVDYSLLLEWAKIPRLADFDLKRILFLDTETSGLAGGTGTFAFMVGLGYFDTSGFTLKQLFLNSPGEENAFLAALEEIASPFDTVVTYNGKSFDIPLLNTRYTLNANPSPFRSFNHIDLLSLSRRIWRNRLNDRSLGNIEQEILQVQRSQEEIPGWMIPDMYYEFLRSGNAAPLGGVFYHNQIDILSLAALFIYSGRLLAEPLNYCAAQSIDLASIARIFEDLGKVEEAALFYENSLSNGLPRPFFIQTLYRYADLSRRKENWAAALTLWEKAADYGEFEAAIDIAKYYEHRSREYEPALEWTNRALTLLEQMPYPLYLRKEKVIEILHRRERLEQKLNRVHLDLGEINE